jgi:hypothetical protein
LNVAAIRSLRLTRSSGPSIEGVPAAQWMPCTGCAPICSAKMHAFDVMTHLTGAAHAGIDRGQTRASPPVAALD